MLKTPVKNLCDFLRRRRLRMAGVQIGAPRLLGANIDGRLGIGSHGFGRIRIESGAWIEQGVVLHAYGGSITIGANAFLGPHAVIYGHGGVEIGANVLIAMHCRILSSNHDIPPAGTDIRTKPDILLPCKIGNDVWLGAGVTVLGGVTIGDGAVVGAGAVVTGDLPPGCIAYGTPATVKSWREGAEKRST